MRRRQLASSAGRALVFHCVSISLSHHAVTDGAGGRETGNLETVLVQLADYYDREVNFTVATFTKLLEPIMMLVLGVVVLFILLSVYLPMMQMVSGI